MPAFDWNKIKAFRKMPKVSDLGISVERISEKLYRLGKQEYAIAPYQAGEAGEKWGNYVTKFVWSPTFDAVKGLILANPSSEEIARSTPPNELLLEPQLYKFEDILEVVRSRHKGEYFTGPTGACASLLERTYLVSVARFDYYFTSGIQDWTGQTPILICWHTSDERWIKYA
jgi:hypothetical protein